MATKETMCFLLLVMSVVAEAEHSGKARTVRAIFARDSSSSGDTCTDRCIVKCCPSGWVRSGGSCYYADDTITTKWEDARAVCQGLGGDLVVITSAEENDFVYKLAMEQETVTERKAWIGLKKNTDDSKWYWVDGTPLEGHYINWGPGEPNNSGGHENCGHFFKLPGKWNDVRCEFVGSWAPEAPTILCEKHL